MAPDPRPFESPLTPYLPDAIWLAKYPIHYGGIHYYSRMTVVRLEDGRLWIHSPAPLDADGTLADQVAALGEVAFLVAPGNFHHLHVAAWQQAFPAAETYACPGVERKQPGLEIDWFLGDRSPPAWSDQIDQVLVRGNRVIWEVAFLHRSTRTLILTDLVENIHRDEPGLSVLLRWVFMSVLRLWRASMPAPEYKIGWHDRAAAHRALLRILDWDFSRMILSHGLLIETDAKDVCREAWASILDRSG